MYIVWCLKIQYFPSNLYGHPPPWFLSLLSFVVPALEDSCVLVLVLVDSGFDFSALDDPSVVAPI